MNYLTVLPILVYIECNLFNKGKSVEIEGK
jgi:hypothetical protein